jgi:hypothetical protein
MRDLGTDLAHAVTRHDRAQSRGKSHNRNALGIYLGRCDDIVARVTSGESLQAAIETEFCDRLRDRVLIYMRDLGYPVAPPASAN